MQHFIASHGHAAVFRAEASRRRLGTISHAAAAASAVASLSQPAARHLADDARREAEALADGLTSAARAAGPIPAWTAR